MKKFFLPAILLLFFCRSVSFAQDSIRYHRLLILPCNPEMYLSDAEHDIMQQTNKTPDEYRLYFRKALDLKIAAELETIIPCVNLLQDSSAKAKDNILHFYGQAGYLYKKPVGIKVNREEASNEKVKKSNTLFSQHEAPKYLTTKGDANYFACEISDTSFYKKLVKTYDSDLVLSINQFEIRTNYNSCMDIANKIYKRELLIHYSLMDGEGKLLAGNFAMAFFPSNTNRPEDIAEQTFPKLALELKNQVKTLLKK